MDGFYVDTRSLIIRDSAVDGGKVYVLQQGFKEAIIFYSEDEREIYTVAKSKRKFYVARRVIRDGRLVTVSSKSFYSTAEDRKFFYRVKRVFWSGNEVMYESALRDLRNYVLLKAQG